MSRKSMLHKLKNVFAKPPYAKDEFYVLDLIQKYIPENSVIFEAGAHEGHDTIRMAKQWPHATIYGFEPVPAIFDVLKNNVASCPNVHVVQKALSSKNEVVQMHISSGRSNGSSSLLEPKDHLNFHPDINFNSSIAVETVTVDDFCTAQGIDKIDFMWLDMQGNEWPVLNACEKALAHVKVVFTEVSLIETYKGVMLYPAFKRWMESKGFKAVQEYLKWKDMGNVVFIKE